MNVKVVKVQVTALLGLALALAAFVPVSAQETAPKTMNASKNSTTEKLDLDVLTGAWMRPDGNYIIVIKKVGPDGELGAMYFNPNPLAFARAQASREGATLNAAFELRAGNYGGSTYQLRYDRASDRLVGTYHQAVAKQSFDVYFVRK